VGYDPDHADILPDVYVGRPGLTGLTQLRDRAHLTQDEILASTIQYVRNYSIFLDIEILIRAVVFLVLKRNRK
jgi:lipopolysaccharide/colanic/teichoic acid biosynthesis glycosyltransferase